MITENKTKTVLDFIKKWNVETKIVSHNKFIKMRNFGELDTVKPNVDDKELLKKHRASLRGLKYIGNEKFDNIIYFSNAFNGNYESILLHELSHILLKIKPNKIDEFKSPLFALWYRFILFNNVNVSILDKDKRDRLMQSSSAIKDIFSSFDDYMDCQNKILIKIGLLDGNLNPTFYYMNCLPDLNWIISGR